MDPVIQRQLERLRDLAKITEPFSKTNELRGERERRRQRWHFLLNSRNFQVILDDCWCADLTGKGLPWLSSAGFWIRITAERREKDFSRGDAESLSAPPTTDRASTGGQMSAITSSSRVKLPSISSSRLVYFLTAQQISAFPPGALLIMGCFLLPRVKSPRIFLLLHSLLSQSLLLQSSLWLSFLGFGRMTITDSDVSVWFLLLFT